MPDDLLGVMAAATCVFESLFNSSKIGCTAEGSLRSRPFTMGFRINQV